MDGLCLAAKSSKVMINVFSFINWNLRGTHPALGEITDRRRTSEEEKPDIPVDFNDLISPAREKAVMSLVWL